VYGAQESLAKSIPWNRFLGFLKVYNFGLRSKKLCVRLPLNNKDRCGWLPYCFLVSGLLDLYCLQEIIDREAKKIEEIGERLSSQTPPAKGIFYF
jgi:hypothetical protein